ncbi:MAG: recombinase family protein [Bacillota bacterium]
MDAPQNVRAPAIYARVSSEDQVAGTSLTEQVDRCLKQAEVFGWNIPPERIYVDDGYSGATLDRPALTRLREDIRQGNVDFVMVYKLDRLSRNIRDTVNLVLEEWARQHRINFRSVTEDFNTDSPLGTLIFSILASFAHFERDVIRERTSSGRRRRAQEGRRPVGSPPYGYAAGPEKGTMVVVPEEARVVRRMFDMYIRGDGFSAIATTLNREGIRTRKGSPWTDKLVRDIIVNETYTGRLKYQKKFWPGKHEPIVDTATFEAAQEVRQTRRRVGGRALGSEFLLAGIARCKACGHTMYTQPESRSLRRRKDGTPYWTTNRAYYICGGRMRKGNTFCRCGHIVKEELEEAVVERLKKRFLDELRSGKYLEELRRETTAQVERAAARLEATKAAVREKQQAIGRWMQAFEKGQLDPVRFGARIARLDQEIQALEEEQRRLAEEVQKAREESANIQWAEAMAAKVDQWDILSFPHKKQILRSLVNEVRVWQNATGRGQHKEPAEIELEIVWNTARQPIPELPGTPTPQLQRHEISPPGPAPVLPR